MERAQVLIKSRRQASLKRSFQSQSKIIEPVEFDRLDIHPHVSVTIDNKSNNIKVQIHSLNRIDELSMQANFFNLLTIGGNDEMAQLALMIDNDPKRNFYPSGNHNCLVNRLNLRSQTPLHIACTNDNLPLVNLLLDNCADPKQKSTVSIANGQRQWENALETSARWGYADIVDCLLKRCQWSRQEVKSAAKLAASPRLKGILTIEASKLRKSGKSHHSVCVIF
jgi:hypothetical protein